MGLEVGVDVLVRLFRDVERARHELWKHSSNTIHMVIDKPKLRINSHTVSLIVSAFMFFAVFADS